MRSFIFKHKLVLPFLFLFFLLLLRNPFSQRTLIPNLEPFPDSFHYVNPALSFLHGRGFVIEREGRSITPSVPPLYSLALVPFFILRADVRMFYFANAILAISSFLLFYAIVRNLFAQKSIRFLLLLLYSTSATLIWFPTLAMAENLLLFLFLGGVLLLISPVKRWCLIAAGFISVAFYATKYASLPLSVAFPIAYAVKLWFELKPITIKKNRSIFLTFVASLVFFGGGYLLYEYIAKGNNVIGSLFSLFTSIFFPKPVETSSGASAGQSFFGTQYVSINGKKYLGWLLGNPITMLWKQIIILPKILAIPSFVGLFLSLCSKSHRSAGLSLLFLLFAVIAFMSLFYAYDGRYFFIAIPSLFLGLGFFFAFIFEQWRNLRMITALSVMLLSVIFFITVAKAVKFQLALNLKYSETPWYYISVLTFDSYLHEHAIEFTQKPVVISALPPYLVDAYAKEKFTLLPLNEGQEFRSHPKEAWGDFDFSNLDEVYADFMRKGNPVFLTEYGLGNEQYLHDTFDKLLEKFEAHKVKTGCFDLCDVYELKIKPATTSAKISPKLP